MAQLQLAAHLGHASAVFAEDDHLGDFAILTKDLRSETMRQCSVEAPAAGATQRSESSSHLPNILLLERLWNLTDKDLDQILLSCNHRGLSTAPVGRLRRVNKVVL